MSKVTVTRKAIVPLKADMLTRIKGAYGTPTEQVAIVADLLTLGYTVDGMVAAAIKANAGTPVSGFTRSAVGRIRVVASATLRGDFPSMTDAQRDAAIQGLITVSNYSDAKAVNAAADLAIKAKTGASAVTAIKAAVKAAGQDTLKSLTTPAVRPVGGEAADGGKATPAITPATPAVPTVKESAGIAAVGLSELVAELARRTSVKAFTVTSVDLDGFTRIARNVERAVTAGRTVTVK